MKFCEPHYKDMTDLPQTFIYFLIDDGEVVYVGQTLRGMSRVYAHYRDKMFNSIYIIPCGPYDDLNQLECEYILKYKPKYNKVLNPVQYVSIPRAAKDLRTMLREVSPASGEQFTVRHLREILHKSNIDTVMVKYGKRFVETVNRDHISNIFVELIGGIHDEIISIKF